MQQKDRSHKHIHPTTILSILGISLSSSCSVTISISKIFNGDDHANTNTIEREENKMLTKYAARAKKYYVPKYVVHWPKVFNGASLCTELLMAHI